MKIIVLYPHFMYPGGASRLVLEVTQRLIQENFDCLVVTIAVNKDLIKDYPKVKFVCLGGPITSKLSYWFTYPVFQIKLHKLLDKYPDKVLFPHVMPSNHWALIYKKFHPEVPIVWYCHEPSAFVHSPQVIESLMDPARTILKITKPLGKIIDKWLVKSADYIIANSKFTAGRVKKIYGRTVDATAYPAVDFNKFKPVSVKNNYIFTVSRLDKAKNIDLLIKAFARLPIDLQEKYSVVIGGHGNERRNLQTLAKSLKLSKRIKFLGEVPESDLPNWYARAKLVTFLSIDEPFGIAPLEAMASGTPVIGTNTGGLRETIIEGKTGYFIESPDNQVLAKKLELLLKEDKKILQISSVSRDYIKKTFSWEKTTYDIKKIIVKTQNK